MNTNSANETQALLGISLSIGTSLDTEEMLKRVAIRITRLTSVQSVAVFHWDHERPNSPVEPRLVISMPIANDWLSGCFKHIKDALCSAAEKPFSGNGIGPHRFDDDDSGIKAFRLPGFGCICLAEPANKLSDFFWEGFSSIAKQLSVTAAGCYAHEGTLLRQQLDQVFISHSGTFKSASSSDLSDSLNDFFHDSKHALSADWILLIQKDHTGRLSTNNLVGSVEGLPAGWLSSFVSCAAAAFDSNKPLFILDQSQLSTGDPKLGLLRSASVEAVAICSLSSAPGKAAIGFALCLWRSGFSQKLIDFRALESFGLLLWSLINRHNQNRTIYRYQSELVSKSREARASASREALANKTKSRFVATVSHDVRTALTGMLSSLELLTDTELDKQQYDRVRQAIRLTEHVNSIMNDVIDLSALEEGKLNLFFAPTKTREFFDEVSLSFRDLAKETGNRVLMEIDTRTPEWVCLDKLRTRQVILNLISNALKATRNGTVSVTVRPARAPSTSKECLHLVVRDEGPGFPEDLVSEVFEPFVKRDHADNVNTGGAGLGLAIVRALVTKMGGQVTLRNRSSRGAEVELWMPFRRPSTEEIASSGRLSTPVASTAGINTGDERKPFAGYRILLVDDDDDVREATGDTLTLLGCDVTYAHDGEQAVEWALSHAFDLIFMDCRMPNMSGWDATKEIKSRLGENRSPAIVALTAAVMQDETEVCYQAGMDDILSKPYSRPKLRDLLGHWLQPEAIAEKNTQRFEQARPSFDQKR